MQGQTKVEMSGMLGTKPSCGLCTELEMVRVGITEEHQEEVKAQP